MSTESQHKKENSYRSILKGTSLLGGVQIFQILINLIRGKFVAMFLGPSGMGIASMFTSSSVTISNLSSLGLNLAFVKEIASEKKDPNSLASVMKVASVLLHATALLGAVSCALLAPLLSRWSFGTSDYTWQFLLLSIAVYLTVAGNGKASLLQGLHRMKLLALSSLAGALTGLLAGVPLYYFFGSLGIVPAMIVLGITSYVCNTLGVRRALPHRPVRFIWQSHKPVIKRLISIGFVMLAATLINSACTYGINIFVRVFGNIADVGLFNAANSITLQYSGVVFAAMAMDYFPRLSAVADDNIKMSEIINRQMEIVALLATPLTILLIVTSPIIIDLLLTEQFASSTSLMRWLGLAILLKAVAYPLGYVNFAKNNKRLFFWIEAVLCNVLYIGLSLIFYYYFGLIGLGYAAVAEQILCIMLYLAVNYRFYGIYPGKSANIETLINLLFGVSAFCASFASSPALSYYLMATVLLICGIRSFMTLRKLGVKD